jgi:hypothetical protein
MIARGGPASRTIMSMRKRASNMKSVMVSCISELPGANGWVAKPGEGIGASRDFKKRRFVFSDTRFFLSIER